MALEIIQRWQTGHHDVLLVRAQNPVVRRPIYAVAYGAARTRTFRSLLAAEVWLAANKDQLLAGIDPATGERA